MDSTVKNMVTSLRAVSALQNEAIRDRHWLQLMQATQVKETCSIVNIHVQCTCIIHVQYMYMYLYYVMYSTLILSGQI